MYVIIAARITREWIEQVWMRVWPDARLIDDSGNNEPLIVEAFLFLRASLRSRPFGIVYAHFCGETSTGNGIFSC